MERRFVGIVERGVAIASVDNSECKIAAGRVGNVELELAVERFVAPTLADVLNSCC